MSTPANNIIKSLFDLLETDLKDGRIDKAIDSAIASHFLARGRGRELEETAIGQVYIAFSAYLQNGEDGSERACSFCGRSGESLRLGTGPEAFICENCVDIFSKRFSE